MTQIKLRRDTSANFTSKNPVLGIGEPAYETDTKKLKIGDGTTAYTQLEYFTAGGGSSTDISATLPLKIVDGVISLEVDGQTIQVVDGKLTASSTAPANMVTTDTAQTITGLKTFAGNIVLDQRQVESGIQCLYTNDAGSIQTSTFIQPQNFSLGASYATLNIGLSDVHMILQGSTIKDSNGNNFLKTKSLTQSEYDGLTTKDDSILYVITD